MASQMMYGYDQMQRMMGWGDGVFFAAFNDIREIVVSFRYMYQLLVNII